MNGGPLLYLWPNNPSSLEFCKNSKNEKQGPLVMASPASIPLILLASILNSLQISSPRQIPVGTNEAVLEPIFNSENGSVSMGFDPSKVIQLSWHPRAFLYEGFLSDEECEHIISLAHGKLHKSSINDTDAGNNTLNSTVSLARGQDEIISKIEERISAWTFLPQENGENMQILHHRINESRAPHFEESNLLNGGNQAATILMHLSTVTRGGEEIFPKSDLKDEKNEDETFLDCASTGHAVQPVRGNALLLFNLHPNATVDERSIHRSCAVLEGEKWTAVKWIRTRAFDTTLLRSDEECTDEDENCSQWAASGECQRNPVFMLGTSDYYGSCRKSCGAC